MEPRRSRNTMPVRLGLLLVLALLLPSAGRATSLGFSFDATVTLADPSLNAPEGSLVHGVVTYDPSTPPSGAVYNTGSIAVQLVSGPFDLGAGYGFIQIVAGNGSSEFDFSWLGSLVASLDFQFSDPAVLDPPTLADFDPLALNDPSRYPAYLRVEDYTHTAVLTAFVGEVQPLPEPGGPVMALLAIAALVVRRSAGPTAAN